MEVKVDRYSNIKGMQLDNSLASFNKDSQKIGQYTFENLNIRLYADKENTSFSMMNDLMPSKENVTLTGNTIGTCVANDRLVVFTTLKAARATAIRDYIYMITPTKSSEDSSKLDYTVDCLYEGDLNFNLNYPIKTKFHYENKSLLKVYWVDGLNLNRFINIVADTEERGKWLTRANPFDFVPELKLEEEVTVERVSSAAGNFNPGVLQYYLTYVNYYGQESNIFYYSPLLYTSFDDRAGMYATNGDGTSNSLCTNCFTISISNPQTEYDYIRVYSTLRTTLDGEPQAKLVTDIDISASMKREKVVISDPKGYKIDTGASEDVSITRYYSLSNFTFYRLQDTGYYKKLDDDEVKELLGEELTGGVSTYVPGRYYKIVCKDHLDIVFTKSYNGSDAAGFKYMASLKELTDLTEGEEGFEAVLYISTTPVSGVQPYTYNAKYIQVSIDPVLAAMDWFPCYKNFDITFIEDSSHVEYLDTYMPILFIDNGTYGLSISPTDLYFLGGTPCSAEAIEQKDNTLFLGNIDTSKFAIELTEDIQKEFLQFLSESSTCGFSTEHSLDLPGVNDNLYKILLNKTSYEIKTFKRGETYRLGLLFLDKFGKWSNIIYIKDILNENKLQINYSNLLQLNSILAVWKVPSINIDPYSLITFNDEEVTFKDFILQLYDLGYRKVRPAVVYPENENRSCVTLGIISPTVFNVEDRFGNSPYTLASWFFRPHAGFVSGRLEYVDTIVKYSGTALLHIKDISYPSLYIHNRANMVDATRWNHLYISLTIKVPTTSDGSTWDGGYVDEIHSCLLVYGTAQHNADDTWTVMSMWVKLYNFSPLHPTDPSTVVNLNWWQKGYEDVMAGIPRTDWASPVVRRANIQGVDIGSNSGEAYPAGFTMNFTGMAKVYGTPTTSGDLHYKVSVAATDAPENGTFLEFRHYFPIPGTIGYADEESYYKPEGPNTYKKKYAELSIDQLAAAQAEISNIVLAPKRFSLINSMHPMYDASGNITGSVELYDKDEYSNVFYIDSSIVTLNSPDLIANETFKTIETDLLKFRIVGYVPLLQLDSNINIAVNSPETTLLYKSAGVNYAENPRGFVKNVTSNIHPYYGGRVLNNAKLWEDEVSYRNGSLSRIGHPIYKFIVYPWQKSNSITNSRNRTSFSSDASANAQYQALWPSMTGLLKNKILANTRTSFYTEFLDTIWYPLTSASPSIEKFTSNELTLIKIDSNNTRLNYYGNVNKIIIRNQDSLSDDTWDGILTGYTKIANVCTTDGYPLMIEDHQPLALEMAGMGNDLKSTYLSNILDSTGGVSAYDTCGTDGALMKYKSTPHFVINFSNSEKEEGLPYMYCDESYEEKFPGESYMTFPKEDLYTVCPHTSGYGDRDNIITTTSKCVYSYLWLGEIYRDVDSETIFGGTSNGMLAANAWLPCGDGVPLSRWILIEKASEGEELEMCVMDWQEGDTYYLRFECMKTYPYTMDDQNSVYDTVSYMAESTFNLDGRYDINKGESTNLAIVPGTNFNLFNPVYSLKNNFFTYQYNNPDKLQVYNYLNNITWTETKVDGELVDTWSVITLTNLLALDGDKGEVHALNKLNNNLYSILDHGISLIKYNENILLSPDNGLPIQLANSGKVDGKSYISELIGCLDKMKILLSDKAIYFVDDNMHAFYGFDGTNVIDISTAKGLSTTIKNADISRVLFDKYLREVYLSGDFQSINPNISLDSCMLAYSESLTEFTSFYLYDYQYMDTVEGNTFLFYNGIIKAGRNVSKYYSLLYWMHNGDFTLNYYSIYIINPSPNDKIFNNIEFNGSCWDTSSLITSLCPFNQLDVWNEYLYGTLYLDTDGLRGNKYFRDVPSSLKLKFRTWRANIPRHNVDWAGNKARSRARIRSPWVYLKLSQDEGSGKALFHDLNVLYYE